MKKMQSISKKALLFGSFILLLNSSGALIAVSVAERGRQIVKTKLAQTRAKIRALSKALDGYQECVFQGTCTKEQKSNLKKLAAATAALVTLLATMTIVGLGAAYKEREQQAKTKERQAAINLKFLAAVQVGNVSLATTLLESGANIEAEIGGWKAIDHAAFNNNKEMVKFLLDSGVYPVIKQKEALDSASDEIMNIILEKQDEIF